MKKWNLRHKVCKHKGKDIIKKQGCSDYCKKCKSSIYYPYGE